MGLWKRTKTSGTGKRGFKSARWQSRVEAKTNARKLRRREDKRATSEF
jgi:hypothetical protein